jgi:ferredoxin--NADP+ reductase
MNPIMVDGTGMCGACRLTVGGKVRFACVEGPDFDAHQVDFDEVLQRSRVYREQEQERLQNHNCNLLKQADALAEK